MEEQISVGLEFETENPLYYIENKIDIEPGKKVEVYLYQKVDSQMNQTGENKLIISSNGYSAEVPFSFTLQNTAHNVKKAYKVKGSFLKIGVIVLATFFLIALVSVGFYKRKTFLKSRENKPKEDKPKSEKRNQKESL
jgi:hypothetical protein